MLLAVYLLYIVLSPQNTMTDSCDPCPRGQQDRSLFDFVDILDPRRHSSDLLWISRPLTLAKAFDQARSKSEPAVLKYNTLESAEMASIIDEVKATS